MRAERDLADEARVMAKLREREPLSPGVHVTHLIYCNVKAWAALRWPDEQPGFDDATMLRFSIGHAVAGDIEIDEMNQVTTVAPDTNDIGTIDMVFQGHPVEIKTTFASVLKPVEEQARSAWMEQLGEYVWRACKRGTKEVWGRIRAVHLLGDHGKRTCPEHGIPVYEDGETPFRRKHPDTNRPRLACPECFEFLVEGNREPTLRCWRVYWTWEELEGLHRIHAERSRQLQEDVENAEYAKGKIPPWRWGFPEFECQGCAWRERIGCPGHEPGSEERLEESLEASGDTRSINEIIEEVMA